MPRLTIFLATVALLVATVIVVARRTSDASAVPMTGADTHACIADSLATLRHTGTFKTCSDRDLRCRAECSVGFARSCLGLAVASQLEPAREAETVSLFQRACLLGEANACTNYAAHIWVREHTAGELACARRTFEIACAAKEQFACGMVGRLMLESEDERRFTDAWKYLEGACEDVSGFPCRVLAWNLESGKLGAYAAGAIESLLEQACEGGDPDACGHPATARETFD